MVVFFFFLYIYFCFFFFFFKQKTAYEIKECDWSSDVCSSDLKSTNSDYIFQFLNQIFVGVTDNVTIKDSVHIQVIRDGKVIDERKA